MIESVCLYFTAMEKSYVPMQAQLLVLPLHVLNCEIFVNRLGFGFIGVAYATDCTMTLLLLVILGIIRFSKDKEIKQAWVKWNWDDVLFELKEFIQIASAGLLMQLFESWSNEAISMMSGLLGALS
jgi:Na+-driven multidrug efflux pump